MHCYKSFKHSCALSVINFVPEHNNFGKTDSKLCVNLSNIGAKLIPTSVAIDDITLHAFIQTALLKSNNCYEIGSSNF
jgi:hypothetical protein